MDTTTKNEMARDCPFCPGTLETVTEFLAMPVGKRTIHLSHTHLKCTHCQEILLEPDDLDDLQKEAANRVREEAGLLTPSTIRAIRNDLGISQDTLEQILSAAPKSVTRWERGTVCQSGAADSILRVFAQSPEMVAVLALDRGLEIPSSPKIKFAYSRYLASAIAPRPGRFDSDLAVVTAETPPAPSEGDRFDDRLMRAAGT